MSASNFWRSGGIAAAAILFVAATAFVAHAQSIASNTITLVTNGEGRVNLHVSGEGNFCNATTSADHAVGISIGDDLCEAWDTTSDTPASLYVKIAPDKISFRRGGKSYVIRDAGTVKRARDLFSPMEEVAQKQSELGKQQRGLGSKQRDFGRQQREVKVKVPDMSADIQRLEGDAKRLNTEGGTQSELGELQSKLGELQSRLGELQSQAGEEQSKLGEQQSLLGEQQSTLGEQQSELGEREGQMAEDAAKQVKALLDQAIANGTAKAE